MCPPFIYSEPTSHPSADVLAASHQCYCSLYDHMGNSFWTFCPCWWAIPFNFLFLALHGIVSREVVPFMVWSHVRLFRQSLKRIGLSAGYFPKTSMEGRVFRSGREEGHSACQDPVQGNSTFYHRYILLQARSLFSR